MSNLASFVCSRRGASLPTDTKKAAGCFARGLKFCVLWMSAILPTTGPAKIKVEAKAEGLGFIQESGSGRSVEHVCTSVVCLCATPGKSGMSIGKFPQIWKSFKKARGGAQAGTGAQVPRTLTKKAFLPYRKKVRKGAEARRSGVPHVRSCLPRSLCRPVAAHLFFRERMRSQRLAERRICQKRCRPSPLGRLFFHLDQG